MSVYWFSRVFLTVDSTPAHHFDVLSYLIRSVLASALARRIWSYSFILNPVGAILRRDPSQVTLVMPKFIVASFRFLHVMRK